MRATWRSSGKTSSCKILLSRHGETALLPTFHYLGQTLKSKKISEKQPLLLRSLVITEQAVISALRYLSGILLFVDFKLETLGDTAQIPRLASSLSACAQLNTLSAGQRTWALHRLRKLVMSEVGPAIEVPALFGYNLMYDQPLVKLKQLGNQRMSTVCTGYSPYACLRQSS